MCLYHFGKASHFSLKAVISVNQLESGNDKGQESSYKFVQVYCNLVKRNNNKTNVNVEKRKKNNNHIYIL